MSASTVYLIRESLEKQQLNSCQFLFFYYVSALDLFFIFFLNYFRYFGVLFFVYSSFSVFWLKGMCQTMTKIDKKMNRNLKWNTEDKIRINATIQTCYNKWNMCFTCMHLVRSFGWQAYSCNYTYGLLKAIFLWKNVRREEENDGHARQREPAWAK